MKVPKAMDIFGAKYRVRVEHRGVRNDLLDERPLGGCCVSSRRQIELNGDSVPERVRRILAHEVLHCVDIETTDAGTTLAERDIYRLAAGLDYVLAKNPAFVAMYAKEK